MDTGGSVPPNKSLQRTLVNVAKIGTGSTFVLPGRARTSAMERRCASPFEQRDIYKEAYTLLERCPYRKSVKTLAVSVFNLSPYNVQHLSLFDDEEKKVKVTQAVDAVNQRFGTYCLTPGVMIGAEELVPDRIAFGRVKELQDYIFEDEEPAGI